MGIIKPMMRQQGKFGGARPGVFQPSGFGGRGVVKPSFGGGKGHGGKGGKGAGQWMFVPAAVQQAPWRNVVQKGFGKGGKSNGKGKSKGNDKYKFMDKLDTIDAERKVWVGGLPKDVTRGNIVEHFKAVAKPGLFEIMSKGTACISFKTAEDATLAIDSLNGSDLSGSDIQVDVWTKKEKKERPEGEKREKKQKPKLEVKKSIKGAGKGKKQLTPFELKMKEKIRAVDHSLKVWVGGLDTAATFKQIKQHFTDNGVEVDLVGLQKPGTACITFKDEDAASNAISLNGSEMDGNVLEVDVWTKPERREKKKKEDEA